MLPLLLQGVIIASNIYQAQLVSSIQSIKPRDYAYAVALWALLLVGDDPSWVVPHVRAQAAPQAD